MITMVEIDRRRDCLTACRNEVKRWRAASENGQNSWRDIDSLDAAEAAVERVEDDVLVALRMWWAQGCREPRQDGGEPAVAELAHGAGRCDCNHAPCRHDLAKGIVDANRIAQCFKEEADKARGLR